MKRRQFIRLVGGAAVAWPLAARAQQPDRIRRIGALAGIENDAEGQARFAAFQQGLQQLGWTRSRNVQIDYRFGGGQGTLPKHVNGEFTWSCHGERSQAGVSP